MKKIATTIEQSRKLIELGLDAATSDMQYFPLGDNKYDLVTYKSCTRGVIPAWSLSALLDILPDYEMQKGNEFGSGYYLGYGTLYALESEEGETPIDLAFDMICWMIENRRLKKGVNYGRSVHGSGY